MDFEKEIQALNGGVLELKALVLLWAKKLTITTTDTSRPRTYNNAQELDYEVFWNKVVAEHDEPQFPDATDPPSPKTQVLFRSTYSNESDQDQQNNFRAERSTTSHAELTVEEGVCLPVDGVRVLLPAAVARANAGFPTELNVCKKDRKSWEETLKWSVDTQITVGARQTTQAKMVVKEQQWSGSFSIVTNVSGKVKVVVRNRNTGQLVTVLQGTIKEICAAAMQQGLNVARIQSTRAGVRFVTNGHLYFRYGVEQRVAISEPEDDQLDSASFQSY